MTPSAKPAMQIRVLLAEDQTMLRGALAALLDLEPDIGVIAQACNGREALEMVRKSPFDAVLMDIQMPGQDGYLGTAQIRRDARCTGERLPVIARTADAMAGEREKALQALMNDYVSKPVDMAALKKTLLRWVNHAAKMAAVSDQKPE